MFSVRGTIPSIIRNDEKLYEGDLKAYFKIVFMQAQNLGLPYHNFRHIFHVVWLCYQACIYYKESMTPREMRNLLIAGMFHDFNHSGMLGDDDLNIVRAIRALEKHLLSEDELHEEEIAYLIRATQFPYAFELSEGQLTAQILRDADMCQAFAMAWIQQIIFGLAGEWNKPPIEILKSQADFLRKVKFKTEWATKMFPAKDIDAKINEANELVELLA